MHKGRIPSFAALGLGAFLAALTATADASAGSGMVAICGNTCVGEDDNGDPFCYWAPASPGQSCKAKGICSPSECTVWWTAQAPTVDVFRIAPAQAKRLPGERTTKGARPPSR